MKTEFERISEIMYTLLAHEPVIDVPYEKINDIAVVLVKEGYGDVSEYKAEIERLRQEVRDTNKMARNTIEQYKNNYDNAFERLKAQEREMERLKAEFKQLQTNAEILARGVRDLNHENYELTEKIKQAQIDVLNKVKNYINDKIENDYGDMSDSVNYLTIDIDDFDDFIDELIREVENEQKD